MGLYRALELEPGTISDLIKHLLEERRHICRRSGRSRGSTGGLARRMCRTSLALTEALSLGAAVAIAIAALPRRRQATL